MYRQVGNFEGEEAALVGKDKRLRRMMPADRYDISNRPVGSPEWEGKQETDASESVVIVKERRYYILR